MVPVSAVWRQHLTAERTERMTCDTCGRESERVARVVIDQGYNRLLAKPLWNCPECFEKKEKERRRRQEREAAAPAAV